MLTHNHSLVATPHLWTALAYYVIGFLLLVVALRVWWMHPVNRAFVFGPYVTEEGLALILRNWMFVFLFGAFILSCGIEHHLEYLASHGRVDFVTVRFAAIIETVISVWTAASAAWLIARRTYLKRRAR
jgi:hypothetical protein